MKAYDLKPTYDNFFRTLKDDAIGRNEDVFCFASLLNCVDDNCAIALDGKWGSGKTFFVQQTKMVIDAHNEFIAGLKETDRETIRTLYSNFNNNAPPQLQPQVCVYYDAWENDNDDDPILSLVYTIVNSVENDFSFKNISCLKLAANILEVFSGRNWTSLIDSFKGEHPLDRLKQAKSAEALVHEFLESLLPEKGNRLVVFIDELDRCKPSYAVQLLERIKHYFLDDKFTFVFSVNIRELQHTIRKYYGDGFDAYKYLNRFFDLWVSLPPPNIQDFYQYLNYTDNNYIYDIVCRAVIKEYHFEFREIAKYLRLTKIAAYVPTHSSMCFSFSDGRALQFCLLYIIPIMIGLRVSDINRYTSFVEGKDYTPLVELSKVIDIRMFENLLEINETYDGTTTPSGKQLVRLESKLKLVYQALFQTDFELGAQYMEVGKLLFNSQVKEQLLRTAGLFSEYILVDEN